MSHFGILSYKGAGHLNPLIALSKQLTAQGHKVTLFQDPGLEEQVRRYGIEFSSISVSHAGSTRLYSEKPKRITWIGEIRYRLDRITEDVDMFLREYPIAIRAAGVDTLIMDEISLAGSTVAEMLGLPYFIVSTSIPHNLGWSVPWSILHLGSWRDRLQKALLEVSLLRMRGPLRWRLDRYRKRVGLGSILNITKSFPALAHITQWPQCLDYRRSTLPANFFYTGPFIDETARPLVAFPWEKLDGRPIVYASLGTTRKNNPVLFHRIGEACRKLDMQLVISLGGRREASMFVDLSEDSLVVEDAPQLELLKRAEIVITHAGSNTVLEALMHGKPMIAFPMTLDQPAVAARTVRVGVAKVLSVKNSSVEDISVALMMLRRDSGYRNRAQEIQIRLRSLRGLERAADIIEQRLTAHSFGISILAAQQLLSTDKSVTTEATKRG